jgi:hypothetical protein
MDPEPFVEGSVDASGLLEVPAEGRLFARRRRAKSQKEYQRDFGVLPQKRAIPHKIVQ